MKKTIHLFKLATIAGLVLGAFTFGNALVVNYATTNYDSAVAMLGNALLTLVAVLIIVLIIAFWRNEL
jgi:hypothetical protein